MVAALWIFGCQSNTIGLDTADDASNMTTSGTGETTSGSMTTMGMTTAVMTTAGPTTTMGPMTTTGPMTSTTASTTVGPADTGWDTDTATSDSGPLLDIGGGSVSFFADVAPILQAQCAPGCHEPGGEWPTQDLLNSPYFALVGVPSTQSPLNKVEPGSLDDSYMWHKLHGTQFEVGGSGLDMPKDAMMLAPEDLDVIETWILDGAPNN